MVGIERDTEKERRVCKSGIRSEKRRKLGEGRAAEL